MMGTFFFTSATETVLLFSIVGFSWAVTSRLPYVLLGNELSIPPAYWDEEELSASQGLIYGLHNLAICLPQILMIALMGLVWLLGKSTDGSLNVVWFLRLGGVCSFVGAYFATKLEEQKDAENRDHTAIPVQEEP